ncbi:hypothetical protein FE257_009398 [Aspergillus nanangensis]|uniref:Uncharacterized protein n=1 Tax=Aspergillus nanangensis TaxID=2582783 RepID=A0AAD4CKP8_ASPNN|nr:hypothetical protein FE257_009398 [Aspergillus nanangensis]
MSKKVIFLMGAPTLRSLNWDEDKLLNNPISPFYGAEEEPEEECRLDDDTQPVKWRLLQDQFDPNAGQSLDFTTSRNAQFLTARDLTTTGDISRIFPIATEDSALFQFYDHSFAVHETSEISAPGAYTGDSTRESGIWTDSTGTSIAMTDDGEVSEPALPINGPIADIESIPSAAYLNSIIPQTMSVNLIVGIITIRPPRRIVTRQWKKELDLVEVVVGDETRSGFGVTFWLPPTEPRLATNKGCETREGHELRQTLASLRPRDVVLLRMVGLSAFRERVYGQSLRKGITTVELLHRQRVDVTDAGGWYSTKRLRDHLNLAQHQETKNDDLPLVKASKVREWIRHFVGVSPESTGGESRRTKRGLILPPDTQEE